MLTIPYTAVQFTALQQFHSAAQLAGLTTSRWGPSVSFLSGAGAGACATVASYPFDLLRTTLAAQGEPRVSAVKQVLLLRQ
jgi:solute carrier family 25 thiamine pyrophosphate transporter 19